MAVIYRQGCRHKLADHWCRSAREECGIAAVAVLPEEAGDPVG